MWPLEWDTGKRPGFLRDACRDDSDLRSEVESLLSQKASGNLLNQSLGSVAADVLTPAERFAAGAMIGPYRIVEPLGTHDVHDESDGDVSLRAVI